MSRTEYLAAAAASAAARYGAAATADGYGRIRAMTKRRVARRARYRVIAEWLVAG